MRIIILLPICMLGDYLNLNVKEYNLVIIFIYGLILDIMEAAKK